MKNVLVCGGAHVDRRGRIAGRTSHGASNPGAWFSEAGGGGFNAARNLARLGFRATMISPRGGDAEGEVVTAAAEQAGVIDRPFVFLDRATPSYTAILENDGNLVIALADMELYRQFTPRRALMRAVRDTIAATDLLLCDANLPEDTILALLRQARACGKMTAGIAISPAKVVRFRPALEKLDFLFMNEAEARALTGAEAAELSGWPAILQSIGLAGGFVTRGGEALAGFDRSGMVIGRPPALDTIQDVTGAGDALAAGALFGLMNGSGLAEAMRHGIACAALTLQSPFAASEALCRESLQSALSRVTDIQLR